MLESGRDARDSVHGSGSSEMNKEESCCWEFESIVCIGAAAAVRDVIG